MSNVCEVISEEAAVEAADLDEFFAPVKFDLVDGLVSEYQSIRQYLTEIHGYMNGGRHSYLSYFIDGNIRDDKMPSVNTARLFEIGGAIAKLNSDFWSRLIGMTNLLDIMSQSRRDEWNKQIHDMTCVDFEEMAVRETLSELYSRRKIFFAEKIDEAFRALSPTHLTNRPEGWSKRFIIAGMVDNMGFANYRMGWTLFDIRYVIASLMGRDLPSRGDCSDIIKIAYKRRGQWLDVDGGVMRIRVYKVGTAHIEIHEDMAWKMNRFLSALYPLAIPSHFRNKPAKKTKEFKMVQRPLPWSVIKALKGGRQATSFSGDSWRASRYIPNSFWLYDANAEAEAVLESLGGVKVVPGNYFQFDYDPTEVIEEITCSGCLPDIKSHQFYPTPASLAERVSDLAKIGDSDSVLEPSAGRGGLADFLPKDQLTCVEINELNCKLLEAKGYTTENADFLQWKPSRSFSRIVMNPPYSEGRWKAHLHHAGSLLEDGGVLTAVLPTTARHAHELNGFDIEVHGPYDNQFPGASISVVILVATKNKP